MDVEDLFDNSAQDGQQDGEDHRQLDMYKEYINSPAIQLGGRKIPTNSCLVYSSDSDEAFVDQPSIPAEAPVIQPSIPVEDPAIQRSSPSEVEVVSQSDKEWMMLCPEPYDYTTGVPSKFCLDELCLYVPQWSPSWFVRAKLAHFSGNDTPEGRFCKNLLTTIDSSGSNVSRKFKECRVDRQSTFERDNLPVWPERKDIKGGYKGMESLKKSLAKFKESPTFQRLMDAWDRGFNGKGGKEERSQGIA